MYIAYDRDEAGDKAAAALAEELMQMGIECFRVEFPKGMDANEYALQGAASGEEPGRAVESRGVAGQRRAASGARVAVPVIVPEPSRRAEPAAERSG